MNKIPLILLCTLLLTGCNVISTPTVPTSNPEWKGLFYKNQEYNPDTTAQQAALVKAPKFSTIQECLNWGEIALMTIPKSGFECVYGCQFNEQQKAIMCKDTTKMIIEFKSTRIF